MIYSTPPHLRGNGRPPVFVVISGGEDIVAGVTYDGVKLQREPPPVDWRCVAVWGGVALAVVGFWFWFLSWLT